MEYLVTIDNFSGPLDLLLHLLKKENVKIEDINIEKITIQYLDYINKMDELNLDVTSEYLVMAASLIEMKSYLLVPKVEVEEEEDPREELIKKLKEYKNYKEVTENLKKLEESRALIYTKLPSDLSDYEVDKAKITEPLDVLIDAFEELLRRNEPPLDTKVTTKEYSIHTRNKEIKDILRKKKKVEFLELFDNFSKDYVIITFLSILDLSKKQELTIEQKENFNKIYLINKGD